MIREAYYKYKDKKGFRDILSLSGVHFALKPIQLAKSFVVAKYLGPELFGILKSVELIGMLNKFGSLGFKPAIIRNATTFSSQGRNRDLRNLKNNAYSGEIILSLILFLCGLISSLFFEDKIIIIAIILASIGLFAEKLLGILETELHLNRQFGVLGKIILYQGLISGIIVIITVPFYNIYSVLVVPIFSAITVTLIAFRKTGFFFLFRIDKIGLLEVLKVSIPLTMATLAFGLFRYVERILIISFLGLTAVGIYGFADTIVGLFITLLLGSVLKVRGIKIFEELGLGNYTKVHKMIKNETIILLLVSICFIIITAIGMKLLIPIFLPKWIKAIDITILFSIILPVKLLSSYIAFVIKSPLINMLKFEPIMQLFATFILIIGVIYLKQMQALNLTNFILMDIVAYLVFHLAYVYVYFQKYYVKYVSKIKVKY